MSVRVKTKSVTIPAGLFIILYTPSMDIVGYESNIAIIRHDRLTNVLSNGELQLDFVDGVYKRAVLDKQGTLRYYCTYKTIYKRFMIIL